MEDNQKQPAAPWIKTYRPKRFEDIIMDSSTKKHMDMYLTNTSQQSIAITGDPGVGKTTWVKCLIRKLLGENAKQNCLRLNAASDQGVKVLDTVVKPFCRRSGDKKIIVMDEADNIKPNHQPNIVSTMKEFETTCRFIFICNDSSKMIEDLKSMCCVIRFKVLTQDQVVEYLSKICEIEGVQYSIKALELLYQVSNGDMRKAINELQKTAFTYNKVVTKTVLKVCNIPDPVKMEKIIELCLTKDNKAFDSVREILNDGYYSLDLTNGLIAALCKADIDEGRRIDLVTIVSKTKIILTSGLKSEIQLFGMISEMLSLD